MKKPFITLAFILIGFQWFVLVGMLSGTRLQEASDQPPTPTPAFDRLAEPTLPANPTQEQLGGYLYYYHCMPCHGDYGQGLTEEWRMVWVEDHRNCWARGCHGGRQEDEGFPIPREIPAVIGGESSQGALLSSYTSIDQLSEYLKVTHPPQQPGRLKDEEYRALAAYLWAANGRAMPIEASEAVPSEEQPGTVDDRSSEASERVLAKEQLEPGANQPMVWRIVIVFLALVVVFLLIIFLQRKKNHMN